MNLLLANTGGGALGAMGQHLIPSQVMRWGTLIVNVVGSFKLGLLVDYLAHRWLAIQEIRRFIVVGVPEGFTTYSTFSLDPALSVEREILGTGFTAIYGNVLLSIGGLLVGLLFLRQVLS